MAKHDEAIPPAASAAEKPQSKAEDCEGHPCPSTIPIFVLRDAVKALAFYERVFKTTKVWKYFSDDGKIMHAFIQAPIGKTGLAFAVEDVDCLPELEPTTNVDPPKENARRGTGMYLYVHVEGKGGCDSMCERMKEAGGTVTMPPMDMFYGSRVGKCVDPFGIAWSFAETADEAQSNKVEKEGIVTEKVAEV